MSEITSQGAPTQVSSSVQAEVAIRVETGLTPAASEQASKSTSGMSCEQQGANVARTKKTELGDVNASTSSKMHTKGDSGKEEDGAPTLGPPKGVLCDVSLLPCFAFCAFHSHVTFQTVDGQHLLSFKIPTSLSLPFIQTFKNALSIFTALQVLYTRRPIRIQQSNAFTIHPNACHPTQRSTYPPLIPHSG